MPVFNVILERISVCQHPYPHPASMSSYSTYRNILARRSPGSVHALHTAPSIRTTTAHWDHELRHDQQRKLRQAESSSVTGDMTDGARRSCLVFFSLSNYLTDYPCLPSPRKTRNVTSSHCWGSGNLDRCQPLLRSAPGSIPGQCKFLVVPNYKLFNSAFIF